MYIHEPHYQLFNEPRKMQLAVMLLRTTNMLERLHEEINRRTRAARLFPNEASLLRLVSAIEMEIGEDWIAGKRYLNINKLPRRKRTEY